MPAKNIVKRFQENSFYHIYNRGVEKRRIYLDSQDYTKFLTILKEALSPSLARSDLATTVNLQGSTFKGVPRMPKNFHETISLHAYCLMPNHFHLLAKQRESQTISAFMQSIVTRYSMYFNNKYKRSGHLFTGIYKASLIEDDAYLLHVSRYIHRNTLSLNIPIQQGHSSYAIYEAKQNTPWLNTEVILDYFKPGTLPLHIHSNTYQAFVEYDEYSSEEQYIEDSLY